MDLKEKIRNIKDFPEKGVIFRDITTLIKDPDAFEYVTDALAKHVEKEDIDAIVVLDARGFLFGAPVAYLLKKRIVPVRKKGKLPCETVSREYALEYGTAAIEIHKDAIKPGQKVVVIDDLIATGGTIEAAVKLIEELGGEVVKVVFLMELAGLKGRERLKDYDVESVICYEGK